MPYVSLNQLPGIYNEASEYGAGTRWVDGNYVRFYKGQPQAVNGWTVEAVTNTIKGVPRATIGWTEIDSIKNLGIGTNKKLYVFQNGTYFDVTPEANSGSLIDPISTTSGSSLVSIAHTGHNLGIGTCVALTATDTVDDVTLAGEYEVTGITSANVYVIESNQTATGTTAGAGGSTTYVYDINAGGIDASLGLGYGVGPFGEGTYGTARSTSDIFVRPRTWALDTWGEDLIANPRGGGIYYWDSSGGTNSKATAISGAPSTCEYAMVSPSARHLLALGADDDELFIRWCSQNDLNDWIPTETNTAGDIRIESGNRIMGGIPTSNNEHLVFTDDALYSLQYVGPPLVFITDFISSGVGIIAPNAMQTFEGITFYMGKDDFFIYDGRLRVLNCDVRSSIFDNLNRTQADKIICGLNRKWEEVWWFYPSASSIENDRYVSYNYIENTWHIGSLERTAWTDKNEGAATPRAFDASGILYNHEQDGEFPSGAFLETGDFSEGEGNRFFILDRIIPDFERNSNNVNFYVKTKRYPASSDVTKGPFAVTSSTTKVDLRARGSQGAIRLESDMTEWRLSSLRVRIRPSGKR